MMNLIPPEAQKIIQFEYWGRVLTVWALVLTVVTLIAGLLLAPTYVLVETQRSALRGDGGPAREANAALEKDVRETNAFATALALPSASAFSYADIIKRIDTSAGVLVVPTGYRVLASEKEGVQMQIQGIAASRASLQSFQDALEAMPEIASVDIPLSDLVRGTDVPFVATVIFETRI